MPRPKDEPLPGFTPKGQAKRSRAGGVLLARDGMHSPAKNGFQDSRNVTTQVADEFASGTDSSGSRYNTSQAKLQPADNPSVAALLEHFAVFEQSLSTMDRKLDRLLLGGASVAGAPPGQGSQAPLPSQTPLDSVLAAVRAVNTNVQDLRSDVRRIDLGSMAGAVDPGLTGDLTDAGPMLLPTGSHHHVNKRLDEAEADMAKMMGEHLELGHAAAAAERLAQTAKQARKDKYTSERDSTLDQMTIQGPASMAKYLNKEEPVPEDFISKIGESKVFKVMCMVIIAVSVLMTALELDTNIESKLSTGICYEGRGPAPPQYDPIRRSFFRTGEMAIFVWMFIELFVNVWTAGGFRKDKVWNSFDVAVLNLTAVQIMFDQMNFSFLRVLRMGRLIKLMRLTRLIKVAKVMRCVRFLHGVRKMVLSMVGSLPSLFWAIFLIFLIIFVVAVIIMQTVEIMLDNNIEEMAMERPIMHENCTMGSGALDPTSFPPMYSEPFPGNSFDPIEDSPMQQVHKIYGSVMTTMMTLFGTISGGSEWVVVAHPIVRMHAGFELVWVVFICVMIFGVLNILTGIFVDAALQAAQNDRHSIIEEEKEQTQSAARVLTEAFEAIDSDHSGLLSEEEFLSVLQDEEVSAMLSHLGLQASESQGLFKLLDVDHSGKIDMAEFVEGCMALKGFARRIDAVTLMYQNKRLAKTVVSLMEMVEDMWSDLEEMQNDQNRVRLRQEAAARKRMEQQLQARAAAKPARTAGGSGGLFEQMDTDGDGVLSKTELARAFGAGGPSA